MAELRSLKINHIVGRVEYLQQEDVFIEIINSENGFKHTQNLKVKLLKKFNASACER